MAGKWYITLLWSKPGYVSGISSILCLQIARQIMCLKLKAQTTSRKRFTPLFSLRSPLTSASDRAINKHSLAYEAILIHMQHGHPYLCCDTNDSSLSTWKRIKWAVDDTFYFDIPLDSMYRCSSMASTFIELPVQNYNEISKVSWFEVNLHVVYVLTPLSTFWRHFLSTFGSPSRKFLYPPMIGSQIVWLYRAPNGAGSLK